jgi:hypothetical protein
MTYPTRLAAILLTSLIAAPAVASDWVPLGAQRDGTQVSLSRVSLERQRGKVSVLARFTPQAGTGWTTFVSVDCWAGTLFAARLDGGVPGAAAIRPMRTDYRPIGRGTTGQSIASALCPATIPADIGPTSIGGGPAMVMPYDPR